MSYHVPKRRKAINLNPWPVAVRRILWIIALLCAVAVLRAVAEWCADHLLAQGKNGFNTEALIFLAPVAVIVTYLLMRREGTETWDNMGQQIQMFIINAVLGIVAVYLLWDRLNLTELFIRDSEESYPYPYQGTIKLMATWFSVTMALQMAGTLIMAVMDTRGNKYDEDHEPL